MFVFSELFDGLLFLPTALAALAFMFQTRHHNLHEHEKLITAEIYALREHENPSSNVIEPVPNEYNDLKEELSLARRRYDYALRAFQCLMISLCLMIVAFVLKPHAHFAASTTLLAISLTLAASSFFFHIFGDLRLAKKHQECIRNRTNKELDKRFLTKH